MSSRNPCHLLAGANDYRAVDVEEAAGEVGDAWLGVVKSFDCGATWTSTLMPGHKLDTSAEGLASPLKGLAAAADATVRAGTSGLFYYSGIAFNRGDGEVGKVFVARFIDNNNKDGADPIKYLDTTAIDTGTSGQFLDKPWIATDIPRGTASCTIDGQTIPAGNAYITRSWVPWDRARRLGSFGGSATSPPRRPGALRPTVTGGLPFRDRPFLLHPSYRPLCRPP